MFKTVFISLSLLLVCGHCMPRDFTESFQEDNTNLEHSELRRPKRALTTICVEIKPSTPKEEPYLMCKGAEMPLFKQGVGNGAYYKKLPYPTNDGGGNAGNGGNFQSFRPEDGYQNKKPFLDNGYEGFPNFNKYGPQGTPEQHFPKAQEPGQYYGQSAKLPSTNYYQQEKPFNGYDAVFSNDKSSSLPQSTQHFADLGARPNGASQTAALPGDKPFQTTTAYHTQQQHQQYQQPFDKQPNGEWFPSSYGAYGGQYATAPTATASNANTQKSSYGPGVFKPTATQASIAAGESEAGPTATSGDAAFVVPATATAGAAFMKTPTVGGSFSGGKSKPSNRHSPMIGEEVLGAPNWGFSTDEFQMYRPQSMNDPTLAAPRLVMQPERTMPPEYFDDPIMRKFYDSLAESAMPLPVPTPAPPPPPPPTPSPTVAASLAPAQVNYPNYAASGPTAMPPQPYNQNAQQQLCPQQPTSCAPCGSSYSEGPTYVALQPNLAASESDSYYTQPSQAPTPCPSRDYRVQPVIIAMPCYGQQGYAQNMGGLPNFGIGGQMGFTNLFGGQQQQYPNYGLSAANQMPNLYSQQHYKDLEKSLYETTPSPLVGAPNPFGPFGAFNPLNPLNPFHPLNALNPFNPLRPKIGLLGQTQMKKEPKDKTAHKVKSSEKKLAEDSSEKVSSSTKSISPDSSEDIQEELTPKPLKESKAKEEIFEDTSAEDSSKEVTDKPTEVESEKPISVTITTDSKTNDDSDEEEQIVGAPLQDEALAKNLEEESQKTFKTMMHGAKTFARLSKREDLSDDEFEDEDELGVKRFMGSPAPPVYKKVYKVKAQHH